MSISINPAYRVTIMQTNVTTGGTPIIVEAPLPENFAFDSNSTYAQVLPQGSTSGAIATVAAALGVRLSVPALTAQLWQGSSETMLQLPLVFHTESDPVNDVQTPIMNLNMLSTPSINSSTGLLQSPGPIIDYTQLLSIAGDAVTSLGNTASSVLKTFTSGSTNSVSNTSQGTSSNTAPVTATLTNPSTTANNGANNVTPPSNSQNPQLGTSQYWKSKISNQISIRIGQYMYFDSVVITNVQQTFISNIDALTGLPHHAEVTISFKPLFMITQEDLASIFVQQQQQANTGVSQTHSI